MTPGSSQQAGDRDRKVSAKIPNYYSSRIILLPLCPLSLLPLSFNTGAQFYYEYCIKYSI